MFSKVREISGYIGATTSFNNKFSLVICRNAEGKFLAVKETRKRGWWIPGGRVELNQNFIQAAHRETIEEAGIDVKLVGVIRFEHSVMAKGEERQRMIFYAEPKDEKAPLKSKPDEESERAEWVDLEEYAGFSHLRGPELIEFGRYVEEGGLILPISMYSREGDDLTNPATSLALMGELMAMQKERARMWSPEKVAKVEKLMAAGLGYGFSFQWSKL